MRVKCWSRPTSSAWSIPESRAGITSGRAGASPEALPWTGVCLKRTPDVSAAACQLLAIVAEERLRF